MSVIALAAVGTMRQETNLWLKQLVARLGTDDHERGCAVPKAVLHALRDRLGPEMRSISGSKSLSCCAGREAPQSPRSHRGGRPLVR